MVAFGSRSAGIAVGSWWEEAKGAGEAGPEEVVIVSEKSDMRSGVEGTEGAAIGIADMDRVDSISERIEVDETFLRSITSEERPALVGD